jgi:hypothetical protein
VSVPLRAVGVGDEVGVDGMSVGFIVEVTCGSDVAVTAIGVVDTADWSMLVEGVDVALTLVSAEGEQAVATSISVKKTYRLDLTFLIINLSFSCKRSAALPGGTIDLLYNCL